MLKKLKTLMGQKEKKERGRGMSKQRKSKQLIIVVEANQKSLPWVKWRWRYLIMTWEVEFIEDSTYSRPAREPGNYIRVGPRSAGRQSVKKGR
jgi:hypothetical protein